MPAAIERSWVSQSEDWYKAPIEYLRQFYADATIGGSTAALCRGLDFFGADHVLFASDFPFEPEGGLWFLRENIRAVGELEISAADRNRIYFGNALKLLGLK